MEELTIELLELGTQMEIQALVEFQAPLCIGRKQKLYRFVSFLDARAYDEHLWHSRESQLSTRVTEPFHAQQNCSLVFSFRFHHAGKSFIEGEAQTAI